MSGVIRGGVKGIVVSARLYGARNAAIRVLREGC